MCVSLYWVLKLKIRNCLTFSIYKNLVKWDLTVSLLMAKRIRIIWNIEKISEWKVNNLLLRRNRTLFDISNYLRIFYRLFILLLVIDLSARRTVELFFFKTIDYNIRLWYNIISKWTFFTKGTTLKILKRNYA